MAEPKVLKTRIQNKYATADAWSKSTLTLLPGELAIMPISASTPGDAIDGTDATTLGYMIKVGNNTTFANSKGLVALAADVHSWAKAATFDEGDYSTGAVGNLTKTHAAIAALQAAIGTGGSVAEMITAAINDLDKEDAAVEKQFVSVVSQENGKISVTRRSIAKDDILSAVKGLARTDITAIDTALTNLETRATALEAATDGYDADNKLIDVIAGLTSRLEDEETATTNYKTRIETLETAKGNHETRIGTLETAKGDHETRIGTAETDIDTLQAALEGYTKAKAVQEGFAGVNSKIEALEGADRTINNSITAIQETIKALEGTTHFIGVKDSLPSSANDGDICIVGNKEYVYDSKSTTGANGTKWVELGDTTAESAAIATLKDITDGYTGKGSIKSAVDGEATARASADAGLQGEIEALETVVSTLTTNNTSAHNTFETGIADLNATLTGYSKEATVQADVNAVRGIASDAQSKAENAQSQIATLKDITDGYTGKGSIKSAVAAAKKAGDDAQADVDALEALVGTAEEAAEGTVYGAMAAHAATAASTYEKKTVVSGINSRLEVVEGKYVYSDGTNLKTAAGETIIFDCGGAE